VRAPRCTRRLHHPGATLALTTTATAHPHHRHHHTTTTTTTITTITTTTTTAITTAITTTTHRRTHSPPPPSSSSHRQSSLVDEAPVVATTQPKRRRRRSLVHPEPVDTTANILVPLLDPSGGTEQSLVEAEVRLRRVLSLKRPAEVQRDLLRVFKEVEATKAERKAKLGDLRQQGRVHFGALEAAMATVFGEVTDHDLFGVHAEKYIPDLLKDVFGGVMILFGHVASHTFDT
jgi:hypothetical protein